MTTTGAASPSPSKPARPGPAEPNGPGAPSGADPALRYSLQVQAATIFQFLRQTFPQMPLLVQVIGWLTFLFLFAFLVLYPVLGYTYFQGRVVHLSDDPNAKSAVRGLRVYKGTPTYTNDDGEFTLALRMLNVPFTTIDLDIAQELVDVPAPLPFVSLFSPNARKIYYVPGSDRRNSVGQLQRFFVDQRDAAAAWESVRKKMSPPPGPTGSRPGGLIAVARAAAAELSYAAPTSTLRFHQLKLGGSQGIVEAFFEITVDGAPARAEGIPGAQARVLDRVTLVHGTATNLPDLNLPLARPAAQVEVGVFAAGFFRSTRVAVLTLDLRKAPIAERFTVEGTDATLVAELLPPVMLGSISIPLRDAARGQDVQAPRRRDAPRWAEYWLEVAPDLAPTVNDVRWLVNDTTFTGLRDRYFYRGAVAFGNLVRARVTFRSGTTLTLVGTATPEIREPRTAPEIFAAIDAYRRVGDADRALQMAARAVQIKGAETWAFQVRGAIQRETGNFDDALDSYERALQLERQSVSVLSGYALTLIDKPAAGRAELQRAVALAGEAIKLEPAHAFSHVALGGAQSRLGQHEAAVETLTRVITAERRNGFSHTISIQRANLYLGRAQLALGRRDAAREALQSAIDDQEKFGVGGLGSQQVAGFARKELARL